MKLLPPVTLLQHFSWRCYGHLIYKFVTKLLLYWHGNSQPQNQAIQPALKVLAIDGRRLHKWCYLGILPKIRDVVCYWQHNHRVMTGSHKCKILNFSKATRMLILYENVRCPWIIFFMQTTTGNILTGFVGEVQSTIHTCVEKNSRQKNERRTKDKAKLSAHFKINKNV